MKNKSKTKMELKGIYGLEKLDCGCEIKHYRGGLTIVIAKSNCANKPKHETHKYYICKVCGIKFTGKGSKKENKEHQWDHAV